MLELLHICPDDKFVDAAIALFNATQCHNSYVCIKDSGGPFKYIHSHVETVTSTELQEICKSSNYNIFVFHTMDYSCYKYVLSLPLDKKIIWLSWGYDLYQSFIGYPAVYPINLYKPITQKWTSSEKEVCPYKRGKRLIKKMLSPFQTYKIKKEAKETVRKCINEQDEVLRRVDYISTVLPLEYSLLIEKRHIKAKYFPFQYTNFSCKEDIRLVDYDKANWILLGNSATATNNHLDILNLCKKRKIQNTLYLPLAYGDKSYAEELKKNINGLNVVYQEEFLSSDIYKMRLMNCRACVFGHLRQQAIGNVIMSLLQGSKVFLYKDSIAYQFFNAEGYTVFTIEDDFFQSDVDDALDGKEIMKNRQLICEWFSTENVLNRLTNFFDAFANG